MLFGLNSLNDVFGREFVKTFRQQLLGFVEQGQGECAVLELDDGVDDCADGIFRGRPGIFDGGVKLLWVRAGRECECRLVPVRAGAIVEGVVLDGDGAFATGAFAFPIALEAILIDSRARRSELGGREEGGE